MNNHKHFSHYVIYKDGNRVEFDGSWKKKCVKITDIASRTIWRPAENFDSACRFTKESAIARCQYLQQMRKDLKGRFMAVYKQDAIIFAVMDL